MQLGKQPPRAHSRSAREV